jgi:hypothetical protein
MTEERAQHRRTLRLPKRLSSNCPARTTRERGGAQHRRYTYYMVCLERKEY